MGRAAEFLGRLFYRPGARGAFRAKPQPKGQSADFTTMILVGASDNGWYYGDTSLPFDQRIMEFGSDTEAAAILGTGDLADAVSNSFSPSKDSRFANGPQLIKAINVSNNAKAGASVDTTKAGNQATVKSIVPGIKGNATRFRVSSGGTIIQVGDAASIQQSSPLVANELSIGYSGDALNAILSNDGTTLAVALTGQNDGSANLSIKLKDYPSVGELVDYINSQPKYSAAVISRPDRQTSWLDHIEVAEAVSVLGAGITLTALLREQERYFAGSGLAEITGVTVRKPLADMVSFSYLTGGTTTIPTAADFINAINFVYDNEVNGFFISICSDETAVAMHLADKLAFGASPDGSFEKFGTSGLNTETPVTDRINVIKMANSEYIALGLCPVVVRQADKITEKKFSGWMIGVIHNAIKASANLRETPTYKDLNIIDAPEKYSRPVINKILQTGGLIVTRKPNNGPFKIEFALTTYQKDNMILNQTSLICTVLGLVKDFREWLQDTYIGEVPTDPSAFGSDLTDADIRTAINNRFKHVYVGQYGWLTRNIYTGESAFNENYTIARDGDAIYFIFPNGNIVSPINFMFSLMNLDVVRGTTTGA